MIASEMKLFIRPTSDGDGDESPLDGELSRMHSQLSSEFMYHMMFKHTFLIAPIAFHFKMLNFSRPLSLCCSRRLCAYKIMNKISKLKNELQRQAIERNR